MVERTSMGGFVARVTAVLFDLGGTLFGYDQRELMRRPALVALQRLGLDTDSEEVALARRQASDAVEREYAARASFVHRDLFRERVARAALLLGVTPTDDVLDRFDAENRQAILDHLVPQSDAAETLLALRERGIYVGVVSNADDDYLGELLTRHALDGLLDDVTSSQEADSCKPHQRIFEYSLRKAGTFANETIFVGDSLPHDVAGAHTAGMLTALIGDADAVAPLSSGLDASVVPDYTIGTLVEIVGIVDRVNGKGA
jgi:putative hydrolase of the HAD superfamily